jgi:hypothetical protein
VANLAKFPTGMSTRITATIRIILRVERNPHLAGGFDAALVAELCETFIVYLQYFPDIGVLDTEIMNPGVKSVY